MYFNSIQYAIYLLVVLFVYYVLPKKMRYIWLLGASYFFYMNWNAKYALLILAVTAISYIAAILIKWLDENEKKNFKKIILFITLIVCFGLLIYFKYLNFIISNINSVMYRMNGNSFELLNIILPVGISFYIFQAVGYVIDVYRKDITPENNPLRFALFVSYFPQLVAGPIERSKNLLVQLKEPAKLTGDRFREGIIYILIGLWQKVVIADIISGMIVPIFDDYQHYSGVVIIAATMLFGIQIYCDFGGYTNIAIGSSKLFGIDLMINFNAPYLAQNVPDFWRRWHISLTSWFRDYLYIPLGGNRKGKLRKYFNTLFIFFVSGVWHGAGWKFIIWGIMNGFMIIASNFYTSKKKSNRYQSKLDIMSKRVTTFLLVDFAWLFFRASSLQDALLMIKHSICHSGIKSLINLQMIYSFGDVTPLLALLASIFILYLIDLVKEKRGSFISYLSEQRAVYRWIFYVLLVVTIIVFGAYGEGYEQSKFIYFQF